jgi:DNA-nicking Smr family endonuclease
MGRDRERDRPGGFADAMSDARPLAGRDKLRPPPTPETDGTGSRPESPVHFQVERGGESVRGRAEGVSRATLEKLRRGRTTVDAEIDLHGLVAGEAQRQLAGRLAALRDEGARCVLVIHGRGQHSAGEAVLRGRIPDWLVAPPLARAVLAFATAPARLGGPGATLVLLRRPGR